jgi:hypothetical protein
MEAYFGDEQKTRAQVGGSSEKEEKVWQPKVEYNFQ